MSIDVPKTTPVSSLKSSAKNWDAPALQVIERLYRLLWCHVVCRKEIRLFKWITINWILVTLSGYWLTLD